MKLKKVCSHFTNVKCSWRVGQRQNILTLLLPGAIWINFWSTFVITLCTHSPKFSSFFFFGCRRGHLCFTNTCLVVIWNEILLVSDYFSMEWLRRMYWKRQTFCWVIHVTIIVSCIRVYRTVNPSVPGDFPMEWPRRIYRRRQSFCWVTWQSLKRLLRKF